MTGGFEVTLATKGSEPLVLMDKASSFLVGHGRTSNARFDLIGHRDMEVEAIEEVLDDVVVNAVVDGSMSEHAKTKGAAP